MRELMAGTVAALATIAGHRVAGPLKALQALGVHVQQLPGAWPLVAHDRFARRLGAPRAAAALQRAVHGRVRVADLARDQARAPAGALAHLADAVLLSGAQHRVLKRSQRPWARHLDSRIRLISHRSFGFHSAASLIALVYLCCASIVIDLPR